MLIIRVSYPLKIPILNIYTHSCGIVNCTAKLQKGNVRVFFCYVLSWMNAAVAILSKPDTSTQTNGTLYAKARFTRILLKIVNPI